MSTSPRITGLLAVVARLQARLAVACPADAPSLAAEMGVLRADLHAQLAALGAVPGALPEPSRRALVWLHFLSDPAHVCAHLEALARANAAARQVVPDLRVSLALVNQASVWRGDRRGLKRSLRVHEAFVVASEEDWRALLTAALIGGARARDAVRRITETAAYRDVLGALEPATPTRADARAHAHDLEAAFVRVNTRYFDGRLEPPALLAWTARPTWRRFGAYEPARDRITISASLDDPTVPAWVVEGVLHHELLHRHLGLIDRGLTRGAHTSAFRAAEATFERAAALDAFLADLARRLRPMKRRR